MADFQFLRLDKPDVMRYLPKFLAEDAHFKQIQDALSWEHEKSRQAIIDLARQFFIDTATWGLSSWERIYQTNPPTDASLDLRRSLLRAKKLGTRTMTKANLELLINQFVTGQDAYIDECVAPGTFRINVPSSVKYWSSLDNMLAQMVPAHLVYFFHYIATFSDVIEEFGDVEEALFARFGYKIEDDYPWPTLTLDGSERLGGMRYLDGSIMLDGSYDLSSAEGGFLLNHDIENIETLTVRLNDIQDDFGQTGMELTGRQMLGGTIMLGDDELPFDDSGEIEIRRNVRYFDGTWSLDGGRVSELSGTFILDGTIKLSEGGIYLENYREVAAL